MCIISFNFPKIPTLQMRVQPKKDLLSCPKPPSCLVLGKGDSSWGLFPIALGMCPAPVSSPRPSNLSSLDIHPSAIADLRQCPGTLNRSFLPSQGRRLERGAHLVALPGALTEPYPSSHAHPLDQKMIGKAKLGILGSLKEKKKKEVGA